MQVPSLGKVYNANQAVLKTPAAVSPKSNGDGAWRDAKWVLCLVKNKMRLCLVQHSGNGATVI